MTRARHIALVVISLIVTGVLFSGCPGRTGQDDVANNTTPGPSEIFDREGLSWYRYAMTNMTGNLTERLLTVEYGNGTIGYQFENGTTDYRPVKNIEVNISWLNRDRQFYVDIKYLVSDGSPAFVQFTTESDGRHGCIAPYPYNKTEPKARGYDISTWFDQVQDRRLYVSGFDFIDYQGSTYYCSVYKSLDDTDFRLWRNASVRLPIKIIANNTRMGGDVQGPWAFDLVNWG